MDQMTDYDDVVEDVRQGLLLRTEVALRSGIRAEQILWDPGLGFAKSHEQNLMLLQGLEKLVQESFPLLVV